MGRRSGMLAKAELRELAEVVLMKILLVEDSKFLRLAMGRELSRGGL
jgi:hypothetical protein